MNDAPFGSGAESAIIARGPGRPVGRLRRAPHFAMVVSPKSPFSGRAPRWCRPQRRKIAMPVTYLITFDVVPEQRDRFLALLNGVLDAMRDEPMFHQASLHVDAENDNRLMLHETWEDHDDVLEVQPGRQVTFAGDGDDIWRWAFPVTGSSG